MSKQMGKDKIAVVDTEHDRNPGYTQFKWVRNSSIDCGRGFDPL